MDKVKQFSYVFFKKQNDILKAHTPSEIVGHLEDIDYSKGTLSLAVGENKSTKNITEVVEAICKQAGCVSNPSALEDWKGFKAVNVTAKREIQVRVQGINTVVFINSEKYKIEYPMGDMRNKLKIWKFSKEVKINAALNCEVQALNRFLEEKGVLPLNPMETDDLLKVFVGKKA